MRISYYELDDVGKIGVAGGVLFMIIALLYCIGVVLKILFGL
jgi:hypothetical protein